MRRYGVVPVRLVALSLIALPTLANLAWALRLAPSLEVGRADVLLAVAQVVSTRTP